MSLQDIIAQPWTAVGLVAAVGIGALWLSIRFLNDRFNKVLLKIDSSISSAELDTKLNELEKKYSVALEPLIKQLSACVTREGMELELLRQEKDFARQLTETRHSIRNELNPLMLGIQATLAKIQNDVAEMRGEMRGIAGNGGMVA